MTRLQGVTPPQRLGPEVFRVTREVKGAYNVFAVCGGAGGVDERVAAAIASYPAGHRSS